MDESNRAGETAGSDDAACTPAEVKIPRGGAAARSPWTALAVAAILVAGAAAYSDSFSGAFIFDDAPVMEQPAARNLSPIWPTLAGARPFVQFTLAVNHRLLGGAAWGYHAFNLAIHLLAALTLFGVVRRTLSLPALSEVEGPALNKAEGPIFAPRFGRASTALAFCIALLWMLHPLQTESVTYITQRMESLMGLFYLLTLYGFIRAVSRRDTRAPGTTTAYPALVLAPHGGLASWVTWRQGSWYAVAVLACGLGMGSKEVMVTAPLVVLLYDRTFIAGSFREALRRRWGFYLALAGTWLIVSRQIMEAFAPGAKSAGFGFAGVTLLQYARSEPGVILHYLALTFWPGGLCLDYGWPVARKAWDILPGAVVVAALLAVTVWALARKRPWGFLGAAFFLILAPSSSIMPIADLAVEHRMYLPLAAVVAAAVLAAYVITPERLRRGAAIALMLALAAALGCRTFARNRDYRSGLSIWQDAREKRPRNARAWYYLGQVYSSMGRPDLALEFCSQAIKIRPHWAAAYDNRGSVYVQMGRYDQAIRDYNEAIHYDPYTPSAWYNRGKARAAAGRLAEAIQDYDEALRLEPNFADVYYNRGNAYTRIAPPEYDQAIKDYDSAIRLNPDYTLAYHNRGIAWACKSRYDLAIRDYDRVIRSHPDFAEAFFHRCEACFHLGRYDQALADCDRAIALKPELSAAYGRRAYILYQLKEFRKALADAETFTRRGGKLAPEFLKALTEAANRESTENAGTANPPRP